MRFLIDECLHESLAVVAHGAGFEATHVNHLGLTGRTDWALAERIVADEFTFVTNNRVDFIRLFGKMDLHAGLIIIVPNAVPSLQCALFEAAILYLAGKALINSVVEVSVKGRVVECKISTASRVAAPIIGVEPRAVLEAQLEVGLPPLLA
jgi:predicted nuclease of predicted toxin-antitoxin system